MRARAQRVGAAAAFDVIAGGSHRSGQDAGLSIERRHRALAMHKEIAPGMSLERDVIVVGRDDAVPLEGGVQRRLDHRPGLGGDRPPTGFGEASCEGDVAKIVGARLARGPECAQPIADRLRPIEMDSANRLTHRTRSAVHHQPQTVVLVGLQLEEVIPAAERGELEDPVAATNCLEPGIRERSFREVRGLRDRGAPMPPPRRNRRAEPGKDLGGDSRIAKRVGIGVHGDGEHAAADVSADGLRVDQRRRGDDDANADLFGKVHVGHHRDVVDVGRAPQAVDGLRHILRQRRRQPRAQRRHSQLSHRRPPLETPAQTTAPAPASA
jgi:hypothetical protein